MNSVAVWLVLEPGVLRLGPLLGNVSFYLKLQLLWLRFYSVCNDADAPA